MSRLDIGAGPSSDCEFQIDIYKWPKTTHILDVMVEDLPFEDESMDEVVMSSFLEHVPPVEHVWKDGKYELLHPRVHVMKECYRVLKHGGILHISVPDNEDAFNQDPTHIGAKVTEGQINYFCGQWGGNKPGDFANDAYGINFAFEKIEAFLTGWILTVRLKKP